MFLAGWLTLGGMWKAWAQIDPTKRELIQIGYDQPIVGRGPLAAYAFYFLNKPNYFDHTNLTLRLAVAPVYLDSELGISHAAGERNDLGLGLAGGGFADSYSEVEMGAYERSESFIGNGGEVSASLYHLFNPGARIPLHAVLRGAAHYASYVKDDDTADDFTLPADQFSFRVRAGLRWGGREPVMLPDLAMEVSLWYVGDFRTDPNVYGFNGDRAVNSSSHSVWARGLLAYTSPRRKHSLGVNLTAGTGFDLDRFSAYRLGGNLPLYSEFPLSLPGYYFQELSARSFVLLGAAFSLPLDPKQHWRAAFSGSTAYVDYLPGLEQPGHWNSGVGGGVVYRSPTDTWQLAAFYGYGINAIRDSSRGAQSITFLLQFDLDRTKRRLFDPSANLDRSRGLQQFFRTIFR